MAVRAKVRCTGRHESLSVHSSGMAEAVTVTLQPVFGGDDDEANREWSKWTPSGEIRLTITNPEAHKQFLLGKTYFVDFTPAE